jgi:membrane protease YdiL (CAAX protease family)
MERQPTTGTDSPSPAPTEPTGSASSWSTRLDLTTIAWITTLLISRLPEIVMREVLGISTPWMPWAVIAITAALWLIARFAAALRPLERYFIVMTFLAVLLAILPLIFQSAAWQTLVPPSGHPMLILLAERVLLAVLAFTVVGLVFLMGTSRSEAYLVAGDINAPTITKKRDSEEFVRWRTFGPIAFVGLLLLTAWLAAPSIGGRVDFGAALPFLVVAAVAAILNAFWEEVAYRAAPLSQLNRAIAPSSGVLILAVWFGLGHFYGGIPSGLVGAVVTAAVALLFGRAMIETRGLAWPLALHFAGDLVIYTFIALAASAPD